jgi:DNA anti-recombination protein RmuC
VIPNFYEYLEVAHLYIDRYRRENGNTTFTPTVSHSATSLQDLAKARRLFQKKYFTRTTANSVEEKDEDEDEENEEEEENCQDDADEKASKIATFNAHPEIVPSIFYGLAKHVDESLIPVKIEVFISFYNDVHFSTQT